MVGLRWRVRLQGVGDERAMHFSFEVGSSPVSLGRSKQRAQLVVDNAAFPATSRLHCSFESIDSPAGAAVRLVDRGSLNGTFVNRRRVEQALLSLGDEIIAGSCEAKTLPGVGETLAEGLVTPGRSAEFQVVEMSAVPQGLGTVEANNEAPLPARSCCGQAAHPQLGARGLKRERSTEPARVDRSRLPEKLDGRLAGRLGGDGGSPGGAGASASSSASPCIDLCDSSSEDEMQPEMSGAVYLANAEQKRPEGAPQHVEARAETAGGGDGDRSMGDGRPNKAARSSSAISPVTSPSAIRSGMRARKPVDYTGQTVEKQISAAIRAYGTLPVPSATSTPGRASPLSADLRKLGLPTAKPRGITGWKPSDSLDDLGAVIFCKETDAKFCGCPGAWFRSVIVAHDANKGYTLRYDDTRASLDGQDWIPVEGDLNNETFVCLLRGSGVVPRRRRRDHACRTSSAHSDCSDSLDRNSEDSDHEPERPSLRSQPSLSQQDDDACYDDACIQVGQEFQAEIPPLLPAASPQAAQMQHHNQTETCSNTSAPEDSIADCGTVFWDPCRWAAAVRATGTLDVSDGTSAARALSSLESYCKAAIPMICRRMAQIADGAARSNSNACAAETSSSTTPTPRSRGGSTGRARGRSARAAKRLSQDEAETLALRALHYADYRTETALEHLVSLSEHTPMDAGSGGGDGRSDSARASIAELLQAHQTELGLWSAGDVSRLITALRKSHFDRLGSPRQLMAMSVELGKSTGELVGWYHYAKKHKNYAHRIKAALSLSS